MFLQYDIGLTTRKVVRTVAGLAQFAFTPATLLRFGAEAARKAQPLVKDVAEKLRSCPANHADETYYRIDGKPAYGWFHGNEDLAHFTITGTRSGKVSRAILGEDYSGGPDHRLLLGLRPPRNPREAEVPVAFEAFGRGLAETATAGSPVHREAFFDAVTQWVKRGCKWHRQWKHRSGLEKEREASWLRQELTRLEQMPTDSERATRLQKRLRRYHAQWLTFMDHPGVSPTNNLAEQALRALVILRKLTFGSRTQAGARRLGRMMTVIETAKRQGQRVVKFLWALFTMPTNRAMRAMYARP